MTEHAFPPAINGTEERLDRLIAKIDRLCDLLTPAPAPATDDGTIELREPAKPPPKRQTTKAKQ